MNEKFKIREEKDGAMLFDIERGKVFKICEDDYQEILKGISEKFSYLFGSESNPLFELFKSKIPRENLPEDCLSAPSKIYLELTRNCNLRCKTCYNSSGEIIFEDMKKEKIFDILNQLYEIGTFEVRFTGGEPTLRDDFFEIVDYAKKLNFFVSVGTNGIWNNEKKERIINSGIDLIIISLDGPEEINDKIRGKGTFKKVEKNIIEIRKRSPIPIRLNMCIAKYNKDCIKYMADFADKHSIDSINTMPIRLNGRSRNLLSNQLLSPLEFYNIINYIEKIRKTNKVRIQTFLDILGKSNEWLNNQTSVENRYTCAAGVEAGVISPNGNFYGCAAGPASNPRNEKDRIFIAGNVFEKSIIDIWLDSYAWRYYRNFKLNKNLKCFKCQHYRSLCFGNCFVSSYFHTGKANSKDIYCFVGKDFERNKEVIV